MPLAFDSVSHGTVAFGFFNIETDMLLLENRFFFAGDFCEQLPLLSCNTESPEKKISWPGFVIRDLSRVGDLMGAIHGVRFTGFIGEVYQRFPFPADPLYFRQNPDGHRTRGTIRQIIKTHAEPTQIVLSRENSNREVVIDGYRFTRDEFHRLIRYIWRGGYPRWKEEVKPGYLLEMKRRIEQRSDSLVEGMKWD